LFVIFLIPIDAEICTVYKNKKLQKSQIMITLLFFLLPLVLVFLVLFLNLNVRFNRLDASKEVRGMEDMRTEVMDDLKSRSGYYLF
jgi:uncharacterized paraquat-inducible protein A